MDGKKEDAKCEGLKSSQAGLLAWLKAKLGIVKAMQASGEPAAFVTPENLSAEAAEKLAEEIRADLEKQLGQPLTLVPLGTIKITSIPIAKCNCLACRMRASARWN